MAKTVVIVDSDLGFVFWLGRLLNDAGYQVWPARSGADAAALLEEQNAELDLLVIDPKSSGAVVFIEEQRRRRGFKTIAIQPDDDEPAVPDGIDAALVKPPRPDLLSALEWMSVIGTLLPTWEQ